MLQRHADLRADAGEQTHHAGIACVDGGKTAVHVGTSSALRLMEGALAPRARQSFATLVYKVVESLRIVNPQ